MTAPLPDHIGPDTPLRLARAAEIAFPGGGMTAAGLRREAARGNLVIERIAGKDFVSIAAISAMREKCRLGQRAPASTSRMTTQDAPAFGSSAMEASELALAAARASAEKLMKSSPRTSSITIPRRDKAEKAPPMS
jgi:hypothetical protein